MKVVISCARSKADGAGYMQTEDGRCVLFVGNPAEVNSQRSDFCYHRPDCIADDGRTWREKLVTYNKSCKNENPLGLLPAYKLYKPNIYTQLVEVFGVDNVYILSAGWGLIQASFLTPNYDITFSGSGYKRRRECDQYCDFYCLKNAINEDLLFFGGQGYLHLFITLTQNYNGRRIVYHSTDNMTKSDRIKYARYPRYFTNWQYKCAGKVMECYEANRCGFNPLRISW